MTISGQTGADARFIPFRGNDFPAKELTKEVFDSLRQRRRTRVALMVGDDMVDFMPLLGEEWLDPRKDYRWSGWLLQRMHERPAKRIVAGTYEDWFKWYMRSQRFRAFQTVVLVEPTAAVVDKDHGGYIDGFLARLMGKVRVIIVVSKSNTQFGPDTDSTRTKEVLRALLFGTRLSRPEIIAQSKRAFVPIDEPMLTGTLERQRWRISKKHPRYRLDDYDIDLVQGMLARPPDEYNVENPGQNIEQLFELNRRFRTELRLPDEMIIPKVIEDVGIQGWVTVPSEAERLSTWLQELNRRQDRRLIEIWESNEFATSDEWLRLLNPQRFQVRRVLETLVRQGNLQKRSWYREVGRPALAYVLPGKAPFLERRCGQCAFYVSVRRRCRLWWLANKRQVFYDPRWKRAGSRVTEFEIHKMKHASRIGPHSSACLQFLDKKRDHLRKEIPEGCEICGETIPKPQADKPSTTCQTCNTRYTRWKGKVKVMTAYEHEFIRVYHEATGGDAKADLEAWVREVKENIRTTHPMIPTTEDFDDVLQEAVPETEPEPPRVWPQFSQTLQSNVDRLTLATDIARQLSLAMAQSAFNATRRIAAFSKLFSGNVDPIVAAQERYLTSIGTANPAELLPYEALIMKQYWLCYGLALRNAQQWFGSRKRSRFVREFVYGPAGRARGYSPVDAAINYLHQRRLRQAERINNEVGFPGTCDGFLHKERYNSRKIGLILDMIDPFKFADREELLLVVLDGGLTWRDFKMESDRHGSTFYYPAPRARTILDGVGADADQLMVRYQEIDSSLTEAYKRFASSLIRALEAKSESRKPEPFVYAPV